MMYRPTLRFNGPGLAVLAPAAERARWAGGGPFWTGSVRDYIAILIVVSVVAAIAVLDRPIRGGAL